MSENLKSVIEVLLFSSERPLTLGQISSVLDGLVTSEIKKYLEELALEYEKLNHGMRIIEVAGGFQMISAAVFAPFLKKLYKQRRPEKLSKPALETLAMVAYKQPVTKMEIEFLRGVNVDGVMKSLLEKELIRIAGRKKAPGRPHLFGTTRQFLEYFGLKSLAELPKIENFQQPPNRGEEIDEPKNTAPAN